ncbi:MAG TPA: ChrR family anti-sigma-E factor [Hyphomicrobium sp.]|nr:ChrR family anti-sigma-E factor [Hyphomicrobium sp.]
MTTITHHPDISTLMCCAAGSQPEAFAAVVASHLALCPECRDEVRRMQEIGVALFDKLEPVPVSCQPPVVAMRAAEADVGSLQADREAIADICKTGVPMPLAKHVGCCLHDVPWQTVAPGIATYTIPLSRGCYGSLKLVMVQPGIALPLHGHTGAELTLVLTGSYTDEIGTFRAGDVADLDEEVTHRPVACPQNGCVCLTASACEAPFEGKKRD